MVVQHRAVVRDADYMKEICRRANKRGPSFNQNLPTHQLSGIDLQTCWT